MRDTEFKPGRIRGGLALAPMVPVTSGDPDRMIGLPDEIILPLSQHAGLPAEPVVEVGESVRCGQPVARPEEFVSATVHASTSGRVIAIEDRPVPISGVEKGPCIVIEPDGRDQKCDALEPMPDFVGRSPAELEQRVRESGIVGMGGGVFPTAAKLRVRAEAALGTLILNGAECDPGISCDDALMQQHADEILAGAQIMLYALQINHCLVAIEDSMADSLSAMSKAVERLADERFSVVAVPTRYPQGGERQLIQVLTGLEVPTGGLPVDIGCTVQNVGTAYAVHDAVLRGCPLIARMVTVAGKGVTMPANVWVRIGTPIRHVIGECGGYSDNETERLVVGGAMMGCAIADDAAPVIKGTNSILAASADEIRTDYIARPCIRCGECARVCPASLLPQQLYWYTKSEDFPRVSEHHVFDCIECGCCDYVCPSHIPLTQYFRYAKSEIWALQRERQRAAHARARYEARCKRDDDGTDDDGVADADTSGDIEDRKKAIADVMTRAASKKKPERKS